MEFEGKIFTEIYVILGVCASVLGFIRGVISVQRSMQKIEFATGLGVMIASFVGLAVLSFAVYFWTAVVSYVF